MLEYMFRGKSMESNTKLKVYKGDWVYGSLIIDRSSRRHLIFVNTKKIIRVSPKTIGIFTGFKANGKKLFIGDIIDVRDSLGHKHTYEIICQDMGNGARLISADRDGDDYGCYTRSIGLSYDEYKLAGNIHDNPRKKK